MTIDLLSPSILDERGETHFHLLFTELISETLNVHDRWVMTNPFVQLKLPKTVVLPVRRLALELRRSYEVKA